MKHSQIIPKFFIVGVRDFSYSKELQSFLKNFPVSGIALFNSPFDNPLNIWKNPEAAMEATHEFVVKASKNVSFISADQEGGRVRRLRSPFIHLPSAQQITEAHEQIGSMKTIEEIYQLAAKQMALTGIRLNFAPVCDLVTPESSKVVGDRSYGSKIETALPFIRTFCKSFEAEGVHTTLKHFPGHGPTKIDSHEEVATVFKSKKEVFKEDREIFIKAAKEASAIMTAHIAFEEDPERVFSLDKNLIEEFKVGLPKDLVWITDDLLSMQAVSKRKPWRAAFDCEYDFVLICGDLDTSAKAIEDCIRHSETKVQNFEHELQIEKRAARSNAIFKNEFQLSKFDLWKRNILELEKQGRERLEKIQIKA